jgi:hypothetical protein
MIATGLLAILGSVFHIYNRRVKTIAGVFDEITVLTGGSAVIFGTVEFVSGVALLLKGFDCQIIDSISFLQIIIFYVVGYVFSLLFRALQSQL